MPLSQEPTNFCEMTGTKKRWRLVLPSSHLLPQSKKEIRIVFLLFFTDCLIDENDSCFVCYLLLVSIPSDDLDHHQFMMIWFFYFSWLSPPTTQSLQRDTYLLRNTKRMMKMMEGKEKQEGCMQYAFIIFSLHE